MRNSASSVSTAVSVPAKDGDDAQLTPTVGQVPSQQEAVAPAATHGTRASEASGVMVKREDGKQELTPGAAYETLGFNFPTTKKWRILTIIFIVQCSMNFNASVYANAVGPIAAEFDITEQTARVAQCLFLIAYAFGCELWAPWSEELGRKSILQASLFLVNVWQILCALAPNYNYILAGRFLGGLSSAGGSVTLGMIADMWEPVDQQYAVAYVVLSSVGGSVLGPVFGGIMHQYLAWRWNFWIQLIFGAVTQLLHYFLVPETRVTCLLDTEAKRLRKSGENENAYGPNELAGSLWQRLTFKHVVTIWSRPFIMFLTEPIVLCLSLLSGFSDALIFTFLESYTPVFKQWNFGTVALGLAFTPLLVGYFIAYFSFMPVFRCDYKVIKQKGPDSLSPERRLWWLLYLAPLEFIGLIGFAWTSLGPSYNIPWIAPLIFSALVGIANYAIYMATIDYMVAAYGPYAASATGGNGFARDFLAGIAAIYSVPFYENIPGMYKLQWPSTILAGVALLVTIPIYVFYWYGPQLRARSKFAQTVASDRAIYGERRAKKQARMGRRKSAKDATPAEADIMEEEQMA